MEQEEGKKSEPTPLVNVDVVCPNCKKTLNIRVSRTRTNPTVPPDYEYESKVQLQLDGLGLAPTDEAAVA